MFQVWRNWWISYFFHMIPSQSWWSRPVLTYWQVWFRWPGNPTCEGTGEVSHVMGNLLKWCQTFFSWQPFPTAQWYIYIPIYIYIYLCRNIHIQIPIYIYMFHLNTIFSDLFKCRHWMGSFLTPDIFWVRGLAYNVTLQGQQLLELQEHRLAPQPQSYVMFFFWGGPIYFAILKVWSLLLATMIYHDILWYTMLATMIYWWIHWILRYPDGFKCEVYRPQICFGILGSSWQF